MQGVTATHTHAHTHIHQVRLETMQPILKMFDRRAFILSEDEAMHVALKDPNRLLGRGRGMADQLKKEEKVCVCVCVFVCVCMAGAVWLTSSRKKTEYASCVHVRVRVRVYLEIYPDVRPAQEGREGVCACMHTPTHAGAHDGQQRASKAAGEAARCRARV